MRLSLLSILILASQTLAAPDALFSAIARVESKGNPRAWNKGEDAVGIVQIRRCVVDDCNRIIGRKKWSYKDRWNVTKSREMFDVYLGKYARNATYEKMARVWNGGPRGTAKLATHGYWLKVRRCIRTKPGLPRPVKAVQAVAPPCHPCPPVVRVRLPERPAEPLSPKIGHKTLLKPETVPESRLGASLGRFRGILTAIFALGVTGGLFAAWVGRRLAPEVERRCPLAT